MSVDLPFMILITLQLSYTNELYIVLTIESTVIIIIIIVKKGRQCKAEREWYTQYQYEDPSPTIPTYRQNEEKGGKK